MPIPNQITACASSSLQGIYRPEIHVYAAAPHPRYGLLPARYFFKGRTRSRKGALATSNLWIAKAKDMTPDDARAFFAANALKFSA